MGRVTRWLKGLLGIKKKNEEQTTNVPISNTHDWLRYNSYLAQNRHAITVAAATAAAADAAVAAAHAAVEVVKLTSRRGGTERFSAAAVKIQNIFRGYLARKALRALKGLVKLQAVVRGYLVRKRSAAALQCMQSLIRAQATVRSQRAHMQNLSLPKILPRKSTLLNAHNLFDESPKSKILEVDANYKLKLRYRSKPRSRKIHHPMSEYVGSYYPTISSPLPDREWSFNSDECRFSTAQTPTKSICGDNFPKYMANTESFMAKLRSHSAPKQRPLMNEVMEARSSLSGVRMQQKSYCSHVVEESFHF